MLYSIVIPYHSNLFYFKLCLDTIMETVPEGIEIIVVWNNEQMEESELEVDENRVRVLKIKQNLGYSKAINWGVKESSGDFLIFCDADTYSLPGWFENLTSFFHSKDSIGIASSKLLNPETSRIIDFGIGLTNYTHGHPYLDRLLDFPLVQESRQVQMACSANMIIEKKLFLEMGMLDEELVNYYQDTDLCLRLKDFGKECWVVGNSIIYHSGSSSDLNRHDSKPDVKGLYVAKNQSRMEFDMDQYYTESFDFLDHKPQDKFLLVDLSTVANREWHYEVFKQFFQVVNTYELGYARRDAKHIALINHLNVSILATKIPILYFSDRFIALKENSLWQRERKGMGDLIVDRHANMVWLDEIQNA